MPTTEERPTLLMEPDYYYPDGEWRPEPLSVYLIALPSFMVGFALCFLIFVP